MDKDMISKAIASLMNSIGRQPAQAYQPPAPAQTMVAPQGRVEMPQVQSPQAMGMQRSMELDEPSIELGGAPVDLNPQANIVNGQWVPPDAEQSLPPPWER